MQPILSIIIPVYNVEKYLTSCLDSILSQDFTQWECILIDDGSIDRSGQICNTYAESDSRFRVLHIANGGVSAARNKGLSIAKGKWISFVDSDDRLADDALTYMHRLSTEMNADVCICPIVKVTNRKNHVKVLNAEEKKKLIWACLAYRTEKYAANGFLIDAPHAKLFRSSIIRDNKIRFVEGLCKSEDALFDAESYHYSNRIVMGAKPVYFYTINPKSICHTYKVSNIEMFDTLLRLEKDMIDKWYRAIPLFQNLIKVRAFVALEQVLYEAGATQLPLKTRVRAIEIFMKSNFIKSIIKSTRNSQISAYFPGRSRKIDLWLVKKQFYRTLCFWVNFCIVLFNVRVSIVKFIKNLFHISQNTSLSSILTR